MKKLIPTFLFCFLLAQAFGQTTRKISSYIFANYNNTLYDYTSGNNPWGVGLGLQAFLINKTKFKPTIELTADTYLEDNKVLRLNPDGSIPNNDNAVEGMVNLLAGASFHPNQSVYVSFMAGPGFISGQTYLGIKPSFGFYFSKTQRWTGKISYINVFNRTKIANADFGSLSLAIGVRLF
ncbi:hypothetical protein EFY79_18865 [Hanamia caeni]|jgi:hypothetical protein|uniref:Outer membrane protein beta-barrel domain-containing protein n=1 Tax=Hanamia caeni TaxID=2294116 RepID=A0A3M9N858_9BACT|nr:hypothetical protein [Hanamia caeni]RNI33507.1 hypothetical protein EFY79_18865 [Hanamia caeni]